MELMESVLHTIISFALVISIIVFVHEFGHFIVARWLGVKVEVFSIGFGPEVAGYTDKRGTRWKIAMLPLGGYIKMYGDAGATSSPDAGTIARMSSGDKKRSFHHKPLWAKAAIVAAGPLFNFLLAIAVFTYFVLTIGIASTEPVVGKILPHTPAAYAGLKPGDKIVRIDGKPIHHFNDISRTVITNLGTSLTFEIERNGQLRTKKITPRIIEETDELGNKTKRPLVGIKSQQLVYERAALPAAVWFATQKTYELCLTSLTVLGQMLVGDRGVEEMKGPLGIAKLSGEVTDSGETLGETTRMFLWFVALLSVNLGLVNLFPIPMLDGGHLMFYILEALRGRPVAEHFQEWSYRLGFVLIVSLMVFTLFNDVRQMF